MDIFNKDFDEFIALYNTGRVKIIRTIPREDMVILIVQIEHIFRALGYKDGDLVFNGLPSEVLA